MWIASNFLCLVVFPSFILHHYYSELKCILILNCESCKLKFFVVLVFCLYQLLTLFMGTETALMFTLVREACVDRTTLFGKMLIKDLNQKVHFYYRIGPFD
ncbi:hypothetical protein ACH5RR_005468 [Cinchona calisaya]|uniref:Uncharacterized protein n=1 Tax=Cinchona calisaya TaxID=153742 RepID=A0ABD3AL76_9GENT